MGKEIYISGRLDEDLDKIHLDDASLLFRALRGFAGKDLEVCIKELTQLRTDKQNRYWWGVLIPCIVSFHKETQGEVITPQEVHSYILINIAGHKVETKEVFGQTIISIIGKTTSQMSKEEWSDLKTNVQEHFKEKGLDIPDPKNNNLLNDYI